MKLSGWGRYPALDCEVSPLRGPDGLEALFARGGSWIARGAGRAYGDAALNPELTVSMLDMNRLRAFDPRTGVLECEAGVLLADILDIFVPRGWFPPVVPGTKFVTVGGMIAAAVVAAIRRKRDVLYVRPIWRPIVAVIACIPERMFKRLRL